MVSASIYGIAAFAASACALAVEKRAGCSSYTIIDTRGTTEPQGPSIGFKKMNANIMKDMPGGKIYNTVYPAAWDQNSTAGTADIVKHISDTLAKNADECFILEGYSQGAAATVDALPKLRGKSYTAVKGVFLIGNPEHKPGLACNVDMKGGSTTKDVTGIEPEKKGIPCDWVTRTLDVCNYGDGVCDTAHGEGITIEHLAYPNDASTQEMGTTFVEKQLKG